MMTQTTVGVTSGAGPHAVTRRHSSVAAVGSESARKKIHARHTRWKVTIRRTNSGAVDASPRAARRRSRASPAPWMAPQTTNVQAAPCHSPPKTIVSSRLRWVRRDGPELPPNGMYR